MRVNLLKNKLTPLTPLLGKEGENDNKTNLLHPFSCQEKGTGDEFFDDYSFLSSRFSANA